MVHSVINEIINLSSWNKIFIVNSKCIGLFTNLGNLSDSNKYTNGKITKINKLLVKALSKKS